MNKNFVLLTFALLGTSAIHAAPVKTSATSPTEHSVTELGSNFDKLPIIVLGSETLERRTPTAAAVAEAGQAASTLAHEAEAAAPAAEAVVQKATAGWKYAVGGAFGGAVLDSFLHPFSFLSSLFGHH
ncbi:hypothetical protein OC846_002799 [Tilletia horrida]|uniref:Uncharacterized protein n=1 Tax=Tilletia horrida TaxID=155126 RepID=A0AAN6JUK7_9BASI|nr:hypothetical protein OC846_002799 [Tilletia horrida]